MSIDEIIEGLESFRVIFSGERLSLINNMISSLREVGPMREDMPAPPQPEVTPEPEEIAAEPPHEEKKKAKSKKHR